MVWLTKRCLEEYGVAFAEVFIQTNNIAWFFASGGSFSWEASPPGISGKITALVSRRSLESI
jgi:hypothetical protein